MVATCGQGDPPANMILNWRRLLSKQLPNNLLEQVNFVFRN